MDAKIYITSESQCNFTGICCPSWPWEPGCHDCCQHYRWRGHQGRAAWEEELLLPGRVQAGHVPALLPVRMHLWVQNADWAVENRGRVYSLVLSDKRWANDHNKLTQKFCDKTDLLSDSNMCDPWQTQVFLSAVMDGGSGEKKKPSYDMSLWPSASWSSWHVIKTLMTLVFRQGMRPLPPWLREHHLQPECERHAPEEVWHQEHRADHAL